MWLAEQKDLRRVASLDKRWVDLSVDCSVALTAEPKGNSQAVPRVARMAELKVVAKG